MKYEKPKIDSEKVSKIINNNFKLAISNLKEIKGGEIARTYSFTIEEENYFIQFNQLNMSQGTRLELKYYDKFKKLNIPVRTVVNQDVVDNLHYAITKEVKGVELQTLNETEMKSILPSIYELLSNISKLQIDNSIGYGWRNSEGNGMFETWKDHINFVMEEEPDNLFYGKWYELFETTFLEKSVYTNYFKKMNNLLKFLPEDRKFLHGNFSFTNILVNNQEISAVIDWQDARYGDTLFDFTYLILWLPKSLSNFIVNDYKNYLEAKNENTKDFYERIKCYKYFFCLDALRFYAKTDQKSNYDYIIELLKEIDSG